MLHKPRKSPGGTQGCHAVLQITVSLIMIFAFVATAMATVSAPPGPPRPGVNGTPAASRSVGTDGLRTSTPTLTRAPERDASRNIRRDALAPGLVPGQPQVDADTVALYHFDDPATGDVDASGNYTATFFGNAGITGSGLYAGALQLDGNNSYVSTGYVGSDVMAAGTIEAYVDFSVSCAGSIFTAEGPSGEVLSLRVDGDGWLRFYVYHDGVWTMASSGINACRYLGGPSGPVWPYQFWMFHHVAGTWGPRGVEIWVDGVLHGVANDDPNQWTNYPPGYIYMCNPQMQIGGPSLGGPVFPKNDSYPACMTPVMAPTMPAYPRGDYTGSLAPYTTFNIGCGSAGCFAGRIDEVRISKVQRAFTWLVDPTITPTPTWTPVNPLSGAYTVDGYTEALYHLQPDTKCGSTWALDEWSQQCSPLRGNAVYVPNGRYGSGLYLDGNGSYLPMEKVGGGTVEAWVDFTGPAGAPQPLFLVTKAINLPGGIMLFGDPGSGTIQLKLNDGNGYLDSGISPSLLAGCWHHVAATWGGRGMEIWVDGILRAANTSYTGGIGWSIQGWQFGCPWGNNLKGCMQGLVDEVRVSSMQRTFSSAALRPVRATFRPLSRSVGPGQPRSGSDSTSQFFQFLPVAGVFPTPTSLYPCP